MTPETSRRVRIVAWALSPALPVLLWVVAFRLTNQKEEVPFVSLIPEFYLNPRPEVDCDVPAKVRDLSDAAFREAVWEVFRKNQAGDGTIAGLREAFGATRLQSRLRWTAQEGGSSGRHPPSHYCVDALEARRTWQIEVFCSRCRDADELHDFLLGGTSFQWQGTEQIRKVVLVTWTVEGPTYDQIPPNVE